MTNKGLPVAGYTNQSDKNVDVVNRNKQLEELVLRQIDGILADGEYDKRWAAIAKTNIEQGFMALNRSVFRPVRVVLDGDHDNAS